MLFSETNLHGAWVITPQPIKDERGFFSRIVCGKEFAEFGLYNSWVQQNISFNYERGTLRGLHYQKGSAAEIKVVRCTQGAIFDVAVDLRNESPTYLQWVGIELNADNHKMFYIPEGVAHGYITLADNTEITYLVSAPYTPGAERGIRYDDPDVAIQWPIEPLVISDKDKRWPYVKDQGMME